MVSRFAKLVTAILTLFASQQVYAEPEEMTVYKTPWCGCCAGWADHIEAGGMSVQIVELEDLESIKTLAGVPESLRSCHTAMVGDYVIEGHVPLATIRDLLASQPAIAGIAVPGMPIGSPGMEGPNPQPYEVITIEDGKAGEVFAYIIPSEN